MKVIQNNFSDGFDFLAHDTQISAKGYYYLINARQRLGYIEPNKKALRNTTVPAGKKQGHIAVDDYLIEFIAGKAWYNLDGTTQWVQIPGFSMDATVSRYYSLAVPVGNVNYIRKLAADGDVNKPIVKNYDFFIAGTPAGVLVQDGINQPWLITFDGTVFGARETKTFGGWENTAQGHEYVPIGKQMFIVDAKLFIVSSNGHNIYQSISGRYLDFMMNVDPNGDKAATEAQGGALTTSFNFDAAVITCVQETNIPSSFIYATNRIVRIITLDYTVLIFGEPSPYVAEKISSGCVNNESVVDILGDAAIVDFEGIKSFNAVKSLKFENDNSIFSLNLAKLLKDIKQMKPRGISFNNYALFNLDTKWGNIIIVYDTILQRWVAFDICGVFRIKQFAVVETVETSKLYAITEQDELFQLYGSTEPEHPQLHTRSFVSVSSTGVLSTQDDMFENINSEYVKLAFQDGSTDATIVLTEQVDGQFSQRLKQSMPENLAGFGFPMQFPIIFNATQRGENITFNMRGGLRGNKISHIIQWDSDAKLIAYELLTSDDTSAVAKKQQERIVGSTYK